MKYDLHVHSKYSHDSLLDPSEILKIAIKRGLDGVAIIDHNTIKGGLVAEKTNKNPDFEVIVGSEIKTEYGDIIGLFLNEEVKSRKFMEVIEEIKNQGGLTALAHPFRPYEVPEKIILHLDFIEGFNARSKKWQNQKAYALALTLNKKVIAGSDAHFSFEIGRGRTHTNNRFQKAGGDENITLSGQESNYYVTHGLSVVLEKIKGIVTFQ
jgi:predicted metal-dependent phosphoesterase TrpH